MTFTLAIIGVIAVLWLGRVAVRGIQAWRAERALRRRELQMQRYCMRPMPNSKEYK